MARQSDVRYAIQRSIFANWKHLQGNGRVLNGGRCGNSYGDWPFFKHPVHIVRCVMCPRGAKGHASSCHALPQLSVTH
eukprot:scaffold190816_cov21-Tisochrysis_lutea.AAC.1